MIHFDTPSIGVVKSCPEEVPLSPSGRGSRGNPHQWQDRDAPQTHLRKWLQIESEIEAPTLAKHTAYWCCELCAEASISNAI
jgi:hypothetical protein